MSYIEETRLSLEKTRDAVGVLHLECDLQGNVGRQLHQYLQLFRLVTILVLYRLNVLGCGCAHGHGAICQTEVSPIANTFFARVRIDFSSVLKCKTNLEATQVRESE